MGSLGTQQQARQVACVCVCQCVFRMWFVAVAQRGGNVDAAEPPLRAKLVPRSFARVPGLRPCKYAHGWGRPACATPESSPFIPVLPLRDLVPCCCVDMLSTIRRHHRQPAVQSAKRYEHTCAWWDYATMSAPIGADLACFNPQREQNQSATVIPIHPCCAPG